MDSKFVSGWYLSSTPTFDESLYKNIGIIQTMNQGIYRKKLDTGIPWCLDNGVFTGKFCHEKWARKLEAFKEYASTCLFVTIPDVVGDSEATIKRFHKYKEEVKGYPVAFVSQDGIKKHKKQIPWSSFDCLFVGGTNEHKLGDEGKWIIEEAKRRSKWIHIGRVNSRKRILIFWDADSWDGTTLSFAPRNVVRISNAVSDARKLKEKENKNALYNFIP